jgi:hypothetical protein
MFEKKEGWRQGSSVDGFGPYASSFVRQTLIIKLMSGGSVARWKRADRALLLSTLYRATICRQYVCYYESEYVSM